jgi:hypothetical protein
VNDGHTLSIQKELDSLIPVFTIYKLLDPICSGLGRSVARGGSVNISAQYGQFLIDQSAELKPRFDV